MTRDDHRHAADLDAARAVVTAAGADVLSGRPWQPPGAPHSDSDLVRFAAWLARDPAAGMPVLAAGLPLLESARSELDQIEVALLFAARSTGMTFQQVAQTLGLGSGQAAQQRLTRVLSRLDRAES